MKRLLLHLALLALAFACYGLPLAIAQDAAAPLEAGMPMVAKVAAWLLAVTTFLRAFAELLHFIAAKTKTPTDDKYADYVSRACTLLGNAAGLFGVGMPKSQLLAKAELIALKELSPEEDKGDGPSEAKPAA